MKSKCKNAKLNISYLYETAFQKDNTRRTLGHTKAALTSRPEFRRMREGFVPDARASVSRRGLLYSEVGV